MANFHLGNRVKVTSGDHAGQLGSVVDIDRTYEEAGVKLDNMPHHLWFYLSELEIIGHDPATMVYRSNRYEPAGELRNPHLTPRNS